MEKKRQRSSISPPHSVPPMSRMNQLPDDVLVLILSKLTMNEAARTTVLSHKWENLWLYYAGSLNFHLVDPAVNIRPAFYKPNMLHSLLKSFHNERPRLISWVNHILNLHQAPSVEEFRVCFDLDATSGDDIERWIKFAIVKSVSKFELDFSVLNGYRIWPNNPYQFQSKLLDSPNNLCRPFGSLTSLRLISVDLSNDVVAYFISNCQSLEQLSIKGSPSLTYLDVRASLKLKHLEIGYCKHLTGVDVSNTNIESVNFHGRWVTPYPSLERLHLLSEVSLRGAWSRRVIQTGFCYLPISPLQSLKLDLGHSLRKRKIFFLEVFPTALCNLKHLEVIVGVDFYQSIFCLTSLLCVCPVLNSFVLKVVYTEPPFIKGRHELPSCEWRMAEKRTHEWLKVVEFNGWHGYTSEMDLLYYLIEKSVVLEKVIINPKLPFYGKMSSVDEDIVKGSRERASLLKKHVRPTTDFLIL